MNLFVSDIVGSTGVFILLLAFILNLLNKIKKESLGYILMNVSGAALACIASYLIHYTPFIILEAVWTIVSLFALIKLKRKKSLR